VESEKEGKRNRVSLSFCIVHHCTLTIQRQEQQQQGAASSRCSSRNRTAANNRSGAAAAATATKVAEKKTNFSQITPHIIII